MSRRSREWWLLALGFALLVASQTRWGVGAFAWVAPAPLLAALRLRPDLRFRAAFAGLSLLAWTLAMLKIVTPPMPVALAVAFGAPLALVHLPAYFLWDGLVRRRREVLAIFAFAACSSLAEWAQAELTPMGVWGAAPTTQVGALAVLQLLALAGTPGLAFLMYAVAAAIEATWTRRVPARVGLALAGVTAAALTWGSLRWQSPIAGPELRAAAIRTDSTIGGLPLPTPDERRRVDDALFRRTADAAAAGARLIVWNEAATLLLPEEEQAFAARAAAAARAHRIELVVAYIMPLSLDPLAYENKLRWYAPDGGERLVYHKLHPVPGEPAAPGPAPAPGLETSFGPASAAICYDYDFPAVARALAETGAGVVALPSSDWRGIDPVHTEMAAMRAIEGGHSIVRSTRLGLSAGIDAHGRLRGQLSANESNEPFLLVAVPSAPLWTPYAALGNAVLLPLLGILGVALAALAGARLRR